MSLEYIQVFSCTNVTDSLLEYNTGWATPKEKHNPGTLTLKEFDEWQIHDAS